MTATILPIIKSLIFSYLTPSVPLSFKGEGEVLGFGGASPLQASPD